MRSESRDSTRLSRSYDRFMLSRRPVSSIQFWGLILLGGSLLLVSSTLMLYTLSYLSHSRFGVAEAFLLLFTLGIAVPIAALGGLHIRRAFAGKH
jgi:hypothetical protein